jgi:hypothetical protein
LRETRVHTGLLFNGTELRLVYAPRGESSGYVTFRVKEMAEVAGRPIFAGLHTLLCAERLFSLPEKQRLPAILADSRKYQNAVSTQLAEQVLAALFELLRDCADDLEASQCSMISRRAAEAQRRHNQGNSPRSLRLCARVPPPKSSLTSRSVIRRWRQASERRRVVRGPDSRADADRHRVPAADLIGSTIRTRRRSTS